MSKVHITMYVNISDNIVTSLQLCLLILYEAKGNNKHNKNFVLQGMLCSYALMVFMIANNYMLEWSLPT